MALISEIKNILPRQAYEQTIKESLTLKVPVPSLEMYNLLSNLALKASSHLIWTDAIDSYSHVKRSQMLQLKDIAVRPISNEFYDFVFQLMEM